MTTTNAELEALDDGVKCGPFTTEQFFQLLSDEVETCKDETFCIHCGQEFPEEQVLVVDVAQDETGRVVPIYACEECDPGAFAFALKARLAEWQTVPTEAERQAQAWSKVDAFFANGFAECEDIWWHDSPRGGYSSFRPVKAVYLCKRGSKAGIGVLLRDGSWLPKVVTFEKLSSRFDD